jgi:hypothetical protein
MRNQINAPVLTPDECAKLLDQDADAIERGMSTGRYASRP